jgi:hypothetical protein
VNEKKQKNFVHLGRAGFNDTGPAAQKFFAPLFFKKAAASKIPAARRLTIFCPGDGLPGGHRQAMKSPPPDET